MYPSRSELIRVAVREFLVKELNAVQSFSKLSKTQIQVDEDLGISIQNIDDTSEVIKIEDQNSFNEFVRMLGNKSIHFVDSSKFDKESL